MCVGADNQNRDYTHPASRGKQQCSSEGHMYCNCTGHAISSLAKCNKTNIADKNIQMSSDMQRALSQLNSFTFKCARITSVSMYVKANVMRKSCWWATTVAATSVTNVARCCWNSATMRMHHIWHARAWCTVQLVASPRGESPTAKQRSELHLPASVKEQKSGFMALREDMKFKRARWCTTINNK